MHKVRGNSPGDFANVVAEHVEIGRCRAGGAGQRIGVKPATDDSPGFTCELPQQTRVRDVLDEQRPQALIPHLTNESGHFTRRRLAFGAQPDRGMKVDAVGAAEVLEGVVRRDHLAPVSGEGVEPALDFLIQHRQFAIIGLGATPVVVRVSRVRGSQCADDIGDIKASVGEILPSVGVELIFAHRQRGDSLAGHDNRPPVTGHLDQPVDPAFKAEAVDDDEVRPGQRAYISRGRFVDMGIAVRTDQRTECDMLPADIPHHVCENGEGGNDFELAGRPGSGCLGQGERGERGKT